MSPVADAQKESTGGRWPAATDVKSILFGLPQRHQTSGVDPMFLRHERESDRGRLADCVSRLPSAPWTLCPPLS